MTVAVLVCSLTLQFTLICSKMFFLNIFLNLRQLLKNVHLNKYLDQLLQDTKIRQIMLSYPNCKAREKKCGFLFRKLNSVNCHERIVRPFVWPPRQTMRYRAKVVNCFSRAPHINTQNYAQSKLSHKQKSFNTTRRNYYYYYCFFYC